MRTLRIIHIILLLSSIFIRVLGLLVSRAVIASLVNIRLHMRLWCLLWHPEHPLLILLLILLLLLIVLLIKSLSLTILLAIATPAATRLFYYR